MKSILKQTPSPDLLAVVSSDRGVSLNDLVTKSSAHLQMSAEVTISRLNINNQGLYCVNGSLSDDSLSSTASSSWIDLNSPTSLSEK